MLKLSRSQETGWRGLFFSDWGMKRRWASKWRQGWGLAQPCFAKAASPSPPTGWLGVSGHRVTLLAFNRGVQTSWPPDFSWSLEIPSLWLAWSPAQPDEGWFYLWMSWREGGCSESFLSFFGKFKEQCKTLFFSKYSCTRILELFRNLGVPGLR